MTKPTLESILELSLYTSHSDGPSKVLLGKERNQEGSDEEKYESNFEAKIRPGNRGSLEVKVTNSWQACHEFEPSTAEDLLLRGAMYIKSVKSSNALPLAIIKATSIVGNLDMNDAEHGFFKQGTENGISDNSEPMDVEETD
ncbi:hypothetical protein TNCV_4488421 [Trichonephila clavipes]|nr:hypothetical protein TNCV_4488421 [Trichonephila clavipes]